MKKTTLFAVILAVGLMAANYAAAGSVVYSGTKGYERISKGVFNLGSVEAGISAGIGYSF
jgi:hypothetical protein